MVSWSLVASMQAFLSGRSSFWACRALLGLIEGGFIPDNILYLSYWYTSAELPIRLSFFWVSYQTTSIVSAFLAYGILHMAGINGLEGWRWLFALEGTLTGLIGIVAYFYLPPSPTQTASKVRGKDGWFSEREEKIMVNRVLRDDPSKGDMHNRQALSFGMFWECICDYHLWPIYLLGLTWLLPSIPVASVSIEPETKQTSRLIQTLYLVHHPEPQILRLQHLRSKPPHHPRLRYLHHKPPRRNLVNRKTQRPSPPRRHLRTVVSTPAHRARMPAHNPQPLGHLGPLDPALRPAIPARRHCGEYIAQCRIGADARGRERDLQHGGADFQRTFLLLLLLDSNAWLYGR